jgi:acyl-CoA synthetase (NDP forming)
METTKEQRRRDNGAARILNPKSVAVIGASDQADKIGGRPIELLLRAGFKGGIFPVNPNRPIIQGLKAYAAIGDVPGGADVAVLAVPAEFVPEALEQCGRAGVGGAVIFSSGFAEIGAEGRAEQAKLLACARRYGLRFVGPNSIGIVNFAQAAPLTFASSIVDTAGQDGPIAVISQSGAMGIAIFSELRERGLGVRYVCATGNQGDLAVADFLLEIAQDKSQRFALLYIEHASDRALLRTAIETAMAAGICVIAVPAGLSQHGRRSAGLHTGGPLDDGVSPEFLESLGVIVAADLADLVDKTCLVAAATHKVPARPRLVLISNSGASCVLAADAAMQLGLALAELSDAAQARLAAVLPAFSLNRNPIDLTAMLRSKPELVPATLDIALSDPGVDVVTFGLVAVGAGYDFAAYAAACAKATTHYRKPVLVYSPHRNVRAPFVAQGLRTFEGERQTLAHVALLSKLRNPR